MRVRRRKRRSDPVGSVDLSLQDVLSNGLCAVIVLTIVASVFSGPGRQFVMTRSRSPVEGSIVLTPADLPPPKPASEARKHERVWLVASGEQLRRANLSLTFGDLAAGARAYPTLYGGGREAVALLQAEVPKNSRVMLRVSAPPGTSETLQVSLRLYVDDREVKVPAAKVQLRGDTPLGVFMLCRSADGMPSVTPVLERGSAC